eukprot:gene142-4388_t
MLCLPLLILSQITSQGFVFRAPSDSSSTIFTVKLVVDQTKRKVYFNGTFTTNTWWILAIRKLEVFKNVQNTHEVFVGEIKNNIGTVTDCYGRGEAKKFQIYKDTNSNIGYSEGSLVKGTKNPTTNITSSPVAHFYWERDFETNDTLHDIPFLDSYRYAFTYAIPSNYSDLTEFSFTQNIGGIINNTYTLVSSTSFREKTFYVSTQKFIFRIIHSCLLLFTWGFAALIGILIARYLPILRKTISDRIALIIHGLLMSFVMLMTIVGFILSFFTTDQHFYSPHGIIGLIVFLSMFLQPLFSVFAILIPASLNVQVFSRYFYFKPVFVIAHRIIGRVCTICALGSSYLGLHELFQGWTDDAADAFLITLTVLFSAYLTIILIIMFVKESITLPPEKDKYE